jgi:radical SAM superfamily enzyme YgiQ (UPF0313 family)
MDLVVQSALLQDVSEIQVVDAIAHGLNENATLGEIVDFRPDWIFCLVGEYSLAEDLAFATRLAETLPDARLVACGDPYLANDESAVENLGPFDAALFDFSSTAFRDLVQGNDPQCDMLVRRGDRVVRLPRSPGKTFSYPVPPRVWFAKNAYRIPFYGNHPFYSLLTSYGCPFRCEFCNVPATGYRERPLDEMIEEISAAMDAGFRNFYFRDASFGLNREKTIELCSWLADRPEKIAWNGFMRVDTPDEPMLDAMAAAGCRVLQFGAETLDDQAARAVGKTTDSAKLRALIGKCRNRGILTSLHLIAGLPEDSWIDQPSAADDILALGADYLAISVLYPRLGSSMTAEGHRLSNENVKRMEALAKRLQRRFYLRPGRMLVEAARLKTPGQVFYSLRNFAKALLS